MNLFTVGRLCVKLAGRDAGRTCVVIDDVDAHHVLIDGDVRRKKANIKHLEPKPEVIDIKKGASHEEVQKAFTGIGLPVWEKKSKESKERPKRQKVKKQKPVKEKKTTKKEMKKEAAKPSAEEPAAALPELPAPSTADPSEQTEKVKEKLSENIQKE